MSGEAHGKVIERSFELTNDPDMFRRAEEEFLAAVEGRGYSDASVFALRLALEEAVVNGFKHGNQGDPDLTVDVAWSVSDDTVRIAVEDRGKGFRPEAVPDPRAPENLDRPSGRGIMLMKAYMSSVRYNDRGNRVEMEYRRPADA